MTKLKWVAAPLSAIFLFACGGGGGSSGSAPFTDTGAGAPPFGSGSGTGGGTGATGDGTRPAADPTVVVSTAAVQGEVSDAITGAALGGATVDLGTATLTTDSSGFFAQATFAATARLVQKASDSGYEDVYVPTPVVTGIPSVSVLKLAPNGPSSTLTGTTGGEVSATSGPAHVTFAANALVDGTGAVSTTGVSVRLTALNPGSDPYALSGDYTSSTGESLEAFGAAILSNAGNLQIDAALPAVLRVPVSTRSTTSPATANLYYLDSSTASWVQDGTATLVATDPAAAYYQGNVSRFGQWLVAQPIASAVQIQGCVQDDSGAAVANARITAEGISYTGLAYAMTDAGGLFSVPAKPSSQLLVSGRRGAVLTNAASVATLGANVNLSPCLTLPSSNAATVRLTWGASPSDIDSHLLVPGGFHVYYASKGQLTGEPYASLDVDDVTSYGPEITTIRRPKVGIYRFYLHNFSGTFSPGMTGSPTRVELNYLGRTVAFSPPAGEGSNRYWHVFDIEVGANCSMTLYRYNRFRSDEPTNPNGSTAAQECVPA
ncbi:MAG TPA: hypothetical protein VJ743_03170 [Albitalea sp.]|nr:hypothetical protein [Albitalea sp.]